MKVRIIAEERELVGSETRLMEEATQVVAEAGS